MELAQQVAKISTEIKKMESAAIELEVDRGQLAEQLDRETDNLLRYCCGDAAGVLPNATERPPGKTDDDAGTQSKPDPIRERNVSPNNCRDTLDSIGVRSRDPLDANIVSAFRLKDDPIDRLGNVKIDRIAERCPTVRHWVELRRQAISNGQHVCHYMPAGVGQGICDAITERELDYVAKHSIGSEKPSSGADEKLLPSPTKAAGQHDQPDELGWTQLVDKFIDSIDETDPNSTNHKTDSDVWQAGYDHCEGGGDAYACPHGADEEKLMHDWLRGWAACMLAKIEEDGEGDSKGGSSPSDSENELADSLI